MVSKLLQDEKQALHKCVQAALAETQNAAGADRAAILNGQEGDVDAAVNAQIQQRRNQKVSVTAVCSMTACSWSTQRLLSCFARVW